MPGVPLNFQAISNVLANYNFVDIASGTGYINFYAGNTVDKYILSNYTYYSDTISTGAATGASNNVYVQILDLDFDIQLKRPLYVYGQSIINIPFGVTTVGGNTCTVYAVCNVCKWDGASEAVLATNTSNTFAGTTNGSSTKVCGMTATDVTIPLTHFKIGETLRLNIVVYGKSSDSVNNAAGYIAHDPKSRTTTWDSTGATPSQLVFQCPVRLNL